MNQTIIEGLRTAMKAFSSASFIVFGSQARGEATADSDLDVCAVFPSFETDPFSLAAQVSAEIHKHLDLAIDVVVSDQKRMQHQGKLGWTLEAVIQREGVRL